uniref:hypothetical protein n=1 Tax=Streptomyces sp. CHD11 TaxID=2741325 RepID=UPI0034D7ADB7
MPEGIERFDGLSREDRSDPLLFPRQHCVQACARFPRTHQGTAAVPGCARHTSPQC